MRDRNNNPRIQRAQQQQNVKNQNQLAAASSRPPLSGDGPGVAAYAKKGGQLNPKFVRWGRFSLACGCVALFTGPTFCLAALLAPLAPFYLLPLWCYPRNPVPRYLATLLAPLGFVCGTLVGAFVFPPVLRAWVGQGSEDYFDPFSSSASSSPTSTTTDVTLADWSPALVVGGFGAAGVFLLLRKPALSSCAFCAPAWTLVYSLPLALVVGRTKARQGLAFSPVPDVFIQLPLILVLIVFGVIE
jgi:hypothetical protein